jgi:1-pyrroline-5-carboxylate dehydrogenase
MQNSYVKYPLPANEPVLSYAPGSPEKSRLKQVLAELKSSTLDIPMYIGAEEVRTNKRLSLHPPHEKAHTLAHYYEGDAAIVEKAIQAALSAKQD